MTDSVITLDTIDFNNSDGEFSFRGETYLIKEYLLSDFIRNQKYVGLEYVCFLEYPGLAGAIYRQEVSPPIIEELLENNHEYIYRCIQYKEALLGFGEVEDKYYSPKHEEWVPLKYINCKSPHVDRSLQEVFEKPYDSFIEQAAIAYTQEVPLIEDEALFWSFTEEKRKIEFVCGSQLELERLTKLAASAFPELQSLFEHSSSAIVTYESDSIYHSGGATQEVVTRDWKHSVILSKQMQQLFNLILEYNFCTGINWVYNDGSHGYPGYDPQPCDIQIEVQAPSQHERIEAAFELQNWLEGKLPEDEIQSYFNQ